MRRHLRSLLTSLLALGLLLGAPMARSQASPDRPSDRYPDRPIRLLIPYSAGGTTDIMARALQEPLRQSLGQTIVVDNKPGASGIIAARETIASAPDGYTLFFVNNGNLAAVPQIVRDAHYDGARDFTPIAMVSTAAMLAVVPASLPVTDLRSFIDYARTHSVNYASAGVGSFGQLATELFANRAGLKLNHIPYKGQGPTVNAVVAGEVDLLVTSPSGMMNEFIHNGRLRLLGVTSATESPLSPGAPPIAAEVPGYVAESWFAIVGPAGIPRPIVDKLNEAISAALEQPDIQERFRTFGMLARTGSPDEVRRLTIEEIDRWRPVIRDNGIRID